jgi:hypothetical protein
MAAIHAAGGPSAGDQAGTGDAVTAATPPANVWDAGRIATFAGPPARVGHDHWLDGQHTLPDGMPVLHWQQSKESGTSYLRQGVAVFHHRTHQVGSQVPAARCQSCRVYEGSRASLKPQQLMHWGSLP